MSKKRRAIEAVKKQQERQKKNARKNSAEYKAGGGKRSKYAAKQRRIEKGDQAKFAASPDAVQEKPVPWWERSWDDTPQVQEDRPDWEIARDDTGLKVSRFHPPKEVSRSQVMRQQVESGLFQTQAYFLNTRAPTELRVGFYEYAKIDADLSFEPGVKPTSLIAKQTGEVENTNKIYSTDPDVLPVWEIRRLTGLGAKTADGKDKSVVVLEGIVKSEEEMKHDLAFWCKTFGTKEATQDRLPGAVAVSRFDY